MLRTSAAGFIASSTDGASARGVDVAGGEVDLEARHAAAGAGGARISAGSRGRSQVVAVDGRGAGELAAGELHAVARVAGEADHRVLEPFCGAVHGGRPGRWARGGRAIEKAVGALRVAAAASPAKGGAGGPRMGRGAWARPAAGGAR